jgi:hypothetical protein
MARTRKVPLPGGNEGEAEVISFRASNENWNDYLLDDGTVLRMKLVVTEVLRVTNQYDQQGNPVYMVTSTNVMAIDAPDELKGE